MLNVYSFIFCENYCRHLSFQAKLDCHLLTATEVYISFSVLYIQ